MKNILTQLPRIFLGLIYLPAGVAGLLNLIPPPTDLPEAMQVFMGGLMATQYFFPLLKITETLGGLLLVTNIAPAFALILLAPITVNIFFVHVFLTPGISNLILPLVMLALHVSSMLAYSALYRPLFRKNCC